MTADRRFPAGFLWGTATPAHPIEGGWDLDGKGESADDVRLLGDLGTTAYRFSISWARVFPDGGTSPHPKGLAFYDRLVDRLLAAGIAPFVTLYQRDLPQALQGRLGGWDSPETAQAFARHAGYVAEQLSDRVRYFVTSNQPTMYVERGHGGGLSAPGPGMPAGRPNRARHHALLGHGLAVQAMRARARPGTAIGFAENLAAGVPVVETPENVAAAERFTREANAASLTAVMEGSYTDAFLAAAGAPEPTSRELDLIASPLDFVGIDVYLPRYVRASGAAPGYQLLPFARSHPRMAASWHFLGPEALYWGPRHLARLWNVGEIYITENGCGTDDEPAADGVVYDTDRVMFLRSHLTQLQRATREGVPVRGYFHWTALDDLAWTEKFGARFGLIHVDDRTLKRTPKLSASFYREVIARNEVV
jgi:beta-glucosidase